MKKDIRETNKSGDLFKNDEGDIYIILKLPLGWNAVSINNSTTWGGLQRTMSMCIDGLEPLGYSINMKEGKRWVEE